MRRPRLPDRPTLALALLAVAVGCNGRDEDVGSESSTGDESDSGSETSEPESGAEDPGPPPIILRLDDTATTPLTLRLDKQAAIAVFGERAKDVTLIEVDSTQMLTNALGRLRSICGDDWQSSANPDYDCTSPEAFGMGFALQWASSPEFALVRLLTMTPRNADLSGTSLETLQEFVNSNPNLFPAGFGGLLADTLGIGLDDPLLPLETAVLAAQQSLLASHPNIPTSDGVLPITLHDALYDMTPLQTPERFGPAGEHPGVMLPDGDNFVTRSDALTEDFSMVVTAATNHQRVDGIDLSALGGGDLFIQNGGDTALEFDFDNLELEGITPVPTIDFRLRLYEQTGPIVACTDKQACADNAPDNVVAPDSIWGQPAYVFEYLVGLAGYLHYNTLDVYECFAFFMPGVCATSALIGDPGNLPNGLEGGPSGWTEFYIGPPFDPNAIPVPETQFFWELLVSIADFKLRDPNGDGAQELGPDPQPTYRFRDLELGLTADDLTEAVKQSLGAQQDVLSDIMIGQYWRNNDAVDLYYWRGSDGEPYLFFATADELRPDPGDPNAAYAPDYPNPGFFACPEMSAECKLSSTQIQGVDDTSHEKLRLATGWSELYAADDTGAGFRLELFVPAGDEAEIFATVEELEP